MNIPSHIFKSFLQELIRRPPQHYFNSTNTIQSSVGMIFRIRSSIPEFLLPKHIINSNITSIQLLFTQRGDYAKDVNARNIVFPGGQCDLNQSDIVACKRELQEQIKLNVDYDCVYIGQFPDNFYYAKKRGKIVNISVHVWILKEKSYEWKPTLNPDQLRQYRWVPFQELLDSNKYLSFNSLQFGVLDRVRLKFGFLDNIKKNIQAFNMPELNLGMDRNLWGLTLWIWSYCLQMALKNIKQQTLEVSEVNIAETTKKLQDFQEHMSNLEIKFTNYYILKYPALLFLKGWHKLYRVHPFTYKREKQRKIEKIIMYSLAVFIVVLFGLYMFL